MRFNRMSDITWIKYNQILIYIHEQNYLVIPTLDDKYI